MGEDTRAADEEGEEEQGGVYCPICKRRTEDYCQHWLCTVDDNGEPTSVADFATVAGELVEGLEGTEPTPEEEEAPAYLRDLLALARRGGEEPYWAAYAGVEEHAWFDGGTMFSSRGVDYFYPSPVEFAGRVKDDAREALDWLAARSNIG